jgi:hypothetical protein
MLKNGNSHTFKKNKAMSLETIQSLVQNLDLTLGIGNNDLGITVYELALDFISYGAQII